MIRTVRPFLRNATAAVLAMLFLSACTSGFVYNRLDWLIPWYVDGYVDLTRAQRDVLRAQLEPRLAWDREEELARQQALQREAEEQRRAAMLISSHRLDEVASLVNRVIELDQGRVVLDDRVADLVDLRSKFYRRYLFRPKFAFDHLLKHARFYWHNMDVFWNLLGIRKVLM